MEPTKVAFSLKDYSFEDVELHLNDIKTDLKLKVDFEPSGVYSEETGNFELKFVFKAKREDKEDDNEIIKICCLANFIFTSTLPFSEIPQYFFSNSIAILFPYVRAFVSTLTLQANVYPILLPTMNLISLQEKLKSNTSVK